MALMGGSPYKELNRRFSATITASSDNRHLLPTMNSIDRHKLHGTYRTPRFCTGAKVTCQLRGELHIVGVSDGRIPRPLGNGRRGARSLVVYGGLARAVRRESVYAICYWFDVDD